MSLTDDRIWDLANLITGFAVAQSIALAYGVATKDARDYFRVSKSARKAVYLLSILTLAAYFYAVWKCCFYAYVLNKDCDSRVFWLETSIWRSLAILYFIFLPSLIVRYSDFLSSKLTKRAEQDAAANPKP